MSWSFYGVGRPIAVLNKARTEIARIRCAEPEETVKNKLLNIIEASLLAMPDASAVKIEASGSQSSDSKDPAKFTNDVKLDITPLWGFVE